MSEMKSLTLNGQTYDSFVDHVARERCETLAVVGSASGEKESIVVSDTSNYRLMGLNICGKTTQYQTTGAQLIPRPYRITGTNAVGVTAEVNDDGSIKCTGTASSSAYFLLYGGYAVDRTPIPDWLVEGETYTISGGTEKVGIALFLYKEDGTAWQRVGSPKTTFVMPSEYSYIGIFVYVPTGKSVDETVYPMLNAGSTAFEYESYTGGKPSPRYNYPHELVSVGNNGSITVNVTGENDTQSMTIATPNGLPGIPVTSGGNYTDANGQQWICDEIDLDRGVYVKRIGLKVFDGTEEYYDFAEQDGVVTAQLVHKPDSFAFCTHATQGAGIRWANDNYIVFDLSYFDTKRFDPFVMFIANQFTLGTPVTIQYILATPIETPLPDEELTAYADLRTYRNSTTVSNDAGAYMELEYVMDAKKYIDSLIAGGSSTSILNATVE